MTEIRQDQIVMQDVADDPLIAASKDVAFSDMTGTGFSLLNAKYDNIVFPTNAIFSESMFISPDGLYLIASHSTNQLFTYTLAAPWNLSQPSVSTTTIVIGQTANPEGMSFKPDGTKMFLVDVLSNIIYQYTLSTPWDVSTATYDTVSFTTTGSATRGLYFKSDGLSCFIVGSTNSDVKEITLTIPWDFSSGVSMGATFVFGAGVEAFPTGISFSNVGTKMFIGGRDAGTLYEFDLSVAWDITTATLTRSLSTASETAVIGDIFVKTDDGLKIYVLTQGTTEIFQYDTPNIAIMKRASDTVEGITSFATQAEVDAGVDTLKAVTPNTLKLTPTGNNWILANTGLDFTTTPTDAGAAASNNIIIGEAARQTSTDGKDNIILGTNARAFADFSVSIGSNAQAGTGSVTIGENADTAGQTGSIAIGKNSFVGARTKCVVIGDGASSGNQHYCTSIGAGAVNDSFGQTNVGHGVTGGGNNYAGSLGTTKSGINIVRVFDQGKLTAVGNNAQVVFPNYAATDPGTTNEGGAIWDSTSKELKIYDGTSFAPIGGGGGAANNWLTANAGADFVTAPVDSGAANSNNILIGNTAVQTNTAGIDNVVIGTGANTNDNKTVSIGFNATCNGDNGIAIGNGADASTNTNSIAIGTGAITFSSGESIAIGYGATVAGSDHYSVAIGKGATTNNSTQVVLGNGVIGDGVIGSGSVGSAGNIMRIFSKGKLTSVGDEAQLVFPNYTTVAIPTTTVEGGTIWDTDTKELKIYNGTSFTAIGGAGATTLNDLTDVNTVGSPAPVAGDVLTYDGTTWVQQTPTASAAASIPQPNLFVGADFETNPMQLGTTLTNPASLLADQVFHQHNGTLTSTSTIVNVHPPIILAGKRVTKALQFTFDTVSGVTFWRIQLPIEGVRAGEHTLTMAIQASENVDMVVSGNQYFDSVTPPVTGIAMGTFSATPTMQLLTSTTTLPSIDAATLGANHNMVIQFQIASPPAGLVLTIPFVKIEEGTTSTNLVSESHAAVLAKCQRFQQIFRVATGFGRTTTDIRLVSELKVPMLFPPTSITSTGAGDFLVNVGSSSATSTGIPIMNNAYPDAIHFRMAVDSIAVGEACNVYPQGTGFFSVSTPLPN